MRNRIVHDYGVVNMTIVYDTVKRGIPEMYEKLKRYNKSYAHFDIYGQDLK